MIELGCLGCLLARAHRLIQRGSSDWRILYEVAKAQEVDSSKRLLCEEKKVKTGYISTKKCVIDV